MNKLTIEDLRGILIACAGGDDAELTGDIAGAQFEDLGYDSLALIETAARLRRDYAVIIPEELITEVRTPRQLLDMVNQQMAA